MSIRPVTGTVEAGSTSVHIGGGIFARLSDWWLSKSLGGEFWRFLAISFLFDSGMFIFFLLYNLYLLDLGFHDDFLGWTTSAMAAGTIAGSLPGGLLTQRLGLRRTLLVCLSLVPAICALRAELISPAWLLSLAFVGGMVAALWAVTLPPVIAQITDERNRAFGFSVIFASGIGFGILAGFVGGYLPRLLGFLAPAGAVSAKRAALLLSCALATLAVWPALRLKLDLGRTPERRHYPRNRFVFRFLLALGAWSFATGAFSPFFNAYFARNLRMPVERIGAIFAGAQLIQVLAIVAAPFVFRRFGLVNGIMYTQFACGGSLGWLASVRGGYSCAAAYGSYMAFQWMSEPGMYTLLMSRVEEGERAGASALNLLTISAARAIAAAAAGVAFTRFGYTAVMLAVVGATFVSGALFPTLVSKGPSETADECRAA